MGRAVMRGRGRKKARRMRYIGVDEKAFHKAWANRCRLAPAKPVARLIHRHLDGVCAS